MKIKLIKYKFKNGDISIDTDMSNNPYSPIVEEYEQVIEVDESKWENKK